MTKISWKINFRSRKQWIWRTLVCSFESEKIKKVVVYLIDSANFVWWRAGTRPMDARTDSALFTSVSLFNKSRKRLKQISLKNEIKFKKRKRERESCIYGYIVPFCNLNFSKRYKSKKKKHAEKKNGKKITFKV